MNDIHFKTVNTTRNDIPLCYITGCGKDAEYKLKWTPRCRKRELSANLCEDCLKNVIDSLEWFKIAWKKSLLPHKEWSVS